MPRRSEIVLAEYTSFISVEGVAARCSLRRDAARAAIRGEWRIAFIRRFLAAAGGAVPYGARDGFITSLD